MKYVAPIGSTDLNANYTDPVEGTIPASAVEQPMREIASVIASMGIVPSETDLTQLNQAIDLKVAAVQPDLSEFVSREELMNSGFITEDQLAESGFITMELLVDYVKNVLAAEKYDLCEFYYFRNPTLKPGFVPAQGEVMENAAVLYPDAWAFLQTMEGQRLCVTEEEWQAMSQATWATLADGTTVGWNGIGGVPFFAPDSETGALRLPDLRGMYAEAAGFDSLGVGGVHGDGVRKVTGIFGVDPRISSYVSLQGTDAFYRASHATAQYWLLSDTQGWGYNTLGFDNSRVVPIANKNQPRAWGALACVYLGLPTA